MRITIEIEDGAVKAVQSQGAGPGEVTNAGGPPAELVQLLGARPAPRPAAAPDGAAVDVGGPPEELLRALGTTRG